MSVLNQQDVAEWQYQNALHQLEDRVAKAKAILTDPQIAFYGSPESYDCMIRRALEALEGK